RIRSRRRGGLAPANGDRLEDPLPRGRDLLPSRRSGTRRAALERLGAGGCRSPADRFSGLVPARRSQGPFTRLSEHNAFSISWPTLIKDFPWQGTNRSRYKRFPSPSDCDSIPEIGSLRRSTSMIWAR